MPKFSLTGSNRALRITLIAGIILFIIVAAVLTVFFLIERSSTRIARQQDSFYRIMDEYDSSAAENHGTDREFYLLSRTLDRLESRAIGVESWLSVLKRRRALARLQRSLETNYRISINNALKAYPFSPQIAAVASAALVKNTALNREAEQQLRLWLSLFTDSYLNNLRISLHVLLGDFNSPQRAAVIPAELFSDGTESVTLDLAVLKILRRNYRGASADIQAMLNNPYAGTDSLRFAAEYHYDFGELSRSAEIFSLIDDEQALFRQADALYLAGFSGIARSIWSILADSPSGNSLYNLAVTSDDSGEAAVFLERLVNMDDVSDLYSRQFGLIRYSRLLDYPQAIAALHGAVNLPPEDFPFIDLEICKRNSRGRELGRQVAQTWLLLDRHPENGELYRWAAWHFFFQRRYDEAEILLDRMDLLQFAFPWANVYRAVNFMFDGNLQAAENTLRSIPEEGADWTVCANLGRILETQRSNARALAQYELAAANAPNPKTGARLHVRIARCLSALGRDGEAILALEDAVALDPENLTARLELDRMTAF